MMVCKLSPFHPIPQNKNKKERELTNVMIQKREKMQVQSFRLVLSLSSLFMNWNQSFPSYSKNKLLYCQY